MDLIGTIYTPNKKELKSCKVQSKWSYESANLCSVSFENTLLFVSSFPLDGVCGPLTNQSSALSGRTYDAGGGQETSFQASLNSKAGRDTSNGSEMSDGTASNCLHHVFVADLNTPWDVHRITSKASEITTLLWDPERSDSFVLADKDGTVEIWKMQESILTEWSCIVRSSFSSETFLKAIFIPCGKRAYLNLDKLDSVLFFDKFVFRPAPKMGSQFGRHDLSGCVLLSHSGLAVSLAYPGHQQPTESTGDDSVPRAINSGLLVCSKSLLMQTRWRIKHADLVFIKDGRLLAATTNDDPKCQVLFFSLHPVIADTQALPVLSLQVDTFPGLFLQSSLLQAGQEPGKSMLESEDDDACQAIVALKFVTGDDCDAILVASQHPSGGRVELWELKEQSYTVNKLFQPAAAQPQGQQAAQPTPPPSPQPQPERKMVVPVWSYAEVFSGPAAQVVSLSTPIMARQTGRAAACYVTIAYTDGSIQCLLRDSLQQIGSVDLPKTGNLCEEPSAKMARTSVTVCDMAFTASGNALIVVDSLGQLYIYRMSPISDPGGLHNPSHLVTMLEYCLVSGYDWWDLTICVKPGHIEAICDRLTADLNRQPTATQQFYTSKLMAMKMSLYRLMGQSTDKSADMYAQLMLQSMANSFKMLLRPSDLSATNDQSAYDRMAHLLHNHKDEPDVDKLANVVVQLLHRELKVDAKMLQSFQHLIQWITNLGLHLMAFVPDLAHHHHLPGYGTNLINDNRTLTTIRELLLLFRVWGYSKESILPSYTKMTDSLDVVAKLFSLITRYKQNPNDESLQDECLMLPSQVLMPPLNTSIKPRGLSPLVVSSHNLSPLAFQFSGGASQDPFEGHATSNAAFDLDGLLSGHEAVDCIRFMYLGKKPFAVKQCTRCCAMSLPISLVKTSLNPSWEKRWFHRCPCGGPWKITCLEE